MTTTSSQATVTVPNVGPVAYDQIMSGIDPELCSDQIPHLAEKYKDESKEDRVKRVERYNESFAKFDAMAADYLKSLHAQKNVQRKQAMASAETEARAEELAQMQQIESQFS
ncbi:MAG: hypothetical protein AAB544_02580 [Patescibacteria group bacterium]